MCVLPCRSAPASSMACKSHKLLLSCSCKCIQDCSSCTMQLQHKRGSMWTTMYDYTNMLLAMCTASAAYSNVPELLELFAWPAHALLARLVGHNLSHSP